MVVQLGGDDRPLVTIEPGPTSTSPPSSPTTTTSSATGEPIYEGMPVDQLPASGIAVTDGDAVVLLDYDGTVLGEVHSVLVTNGLGSGPGLSTLLVRPGPSFEIGGPESVEAAAGCDTPAGGGGLRVMLCGGAEQLRERVVTVDPLGVEDDLIEAAPGRQEMGHWRWALPSPDGRMVLAQWSGECEVPTAFFVPANGVEPRTVTGDEEVGGATESLGLGWAPDGRAAVQLLGGACGSGVDVPGVYLVDPANGERTLVRAAASDQTQRASLAPRAPDRQLPRAHLRAAPCASSGSMGAAVSRHTGAPRPPRASSGKGRTSRCSGAQSESRTSYPSTTS